jgi:tetratricopeptide (TPR) repeat protein
MGNLAIHYDNFGRNADALKLREEVMAHSKATLGPDHPFTLKSMRGLAVSYANLGRHADALKLDEQTLAPYKAKLGPDHPDTLASMNNLAIDYASVGREIEALALREETLALRRARFAPDHPETLRSMHNLAHSYGRLGRNAESLKLYEETLALQRAKLGPDNPDTVRSMRGLAGFLATTSDPQFRDPPRAVELAAKAAELSPTEPNVRGVLGTAYYLTGDWKGAIAELEKAINLRTPDNPNNASNGFFLAMAHWQLSEKDKARECFDKAVQWMNQRSPNNTELKRFRAEAAELLGVEKKD